jgi:hypothetical protein
MAQYPQGIFQSLNWLLKKVRIILATTYISRQGSFEDSTTQSNAGITSVNIVTFNSTSQSNGISVVSNSRITYVTTGKYFINFLGQFFFSGGASNFNITIWLRKNGVDLVDSSYTFTTTSAQGAQILGNLEDILSLNAGDYIEVCWWAGAAGITLTPTAIQSNPTRPASPSANLNTFRVG